MSGKLLIVTDCHAPNTLEFQGISNHIFENNLNKNAQIVHINLPQLLRVQIGSEMSQQFNTILT